MSQLEVGLTSTTSCRRRSNSCSLACTLRSRELERTMRAVGMTRMGSHCTPGGMQPRRTQIARRSVPSRESGIRSASNRLAEWPGAVGTRASARRDNRGSTETTGAPRTDTVWTAQSRNTATDSARSSWRASMFPSIAISYRELERPCTQRRNYCVHRRCS